MGENVDNGTNWDKEFSDAFDRQKQRDAEKEKDDSKLEILHDGYGRIVFESKKHSCL